MQASSAQPQRNDQSKPKYQSDHCVRKPIILTQKPKSCRKGYLERVTVTKMGPCGEPRNSRERFGIRRFLKHHHIQVLYRYCVQSNLSQVFLKSATAFSARTPEMVPSAPSCGLPLPPLPAPPPTARRIRSGSRSSSPATTSRQKLVSMVPSDSTGCTMPP